MVIKKYFFEFHQNNYQKRESPPPHTHTLINWSFHKLIMDSPQKYSQLTVRIRKYIYLSLTICADQH